MGTCKTCKWWDDNGQCDKVGNIQATKHPNTLFDIICDAADDTGLWAALKTGPDFGCTYHEVSK
jgi:hypothetical protein